MASIVWQSCEKQEVTQLQLGVDGLGRVETRAQGGLEHIPYDIAISTLYWEDSKGYPKYV
jgi:hypothetical protein